MKKEIFHKKRIVYLLNNTKKAITIFFNKESSKNGQYAVYFNHNTVIINKLKKIFNKKFKYGKKSIVFNIHDPYQFRVIIFCIALGLDYKKNRKAFELINVINFIEKNIHKKISILCMLKKLNYDYRESNQYFQSVLGLKIREYIFKRRLSEAACQIRLTDDSITKITHNFSFKNESQFWREFKNHFKLTPLKFRSQTHECVLFNKFDVVNFFCRLNHDYDWQSHITYVIYNEANIKGLTKIAKNFSDIPLDYDFLTDNFDLENNNVFCLYHNINQNKEFDFTIGGLSQNCVRQATDMCEYVIPSAQYAKLTVPSKSYKKLIGFIFETWIYLNDNLPELIFEVHHKEYVDIYISVN